VSYQEIGEKIKVMAVFKNGTIFPYIFEWNNRRHKIEKVNLSYQEREGTSINYYFATESKGLVAKIKFNDKTMVWSIEEIWNQ
jgi:hypothetical protein